MSFEIKILGSTSATPVLNRHQSAQLLTLEQNLFLIDCGESTQHQLLKYKAKINRIDTILISHLHGDHYLGVVGLISTMHLQGRTRDLAIYSPAGLDEIITLQLKISETFLNYKINFHEINTNENNILIDAPQYTVASIPLNHRINCAGFLFKEKTKKRRLRKELLPDPFSLANINLLKNGMDVLDENGEILYHNEAYTLPPKKPRSYAYCSDTKYDESIIPSIREVDLLYHEATFLSNLSERANITYHSTAHQAASIAQKANVKKLVIGHFSSRYKDLNPLLEEAKEVFANTFLAIEGLSFTISVSS